MMDILDVGLAIAAVCAILSRSCWSADHCLMLPVTAMLRMLPVCSLRSA
jgi:hypothetical protein